MPDTSIRLGPVLGELAGRMILVLLSASSYKPEPDCLSFGRKHFAELAERLRTYEHAQVPGVLGIAPASSGRHT